MSADRNNEAEDFRAWTPDFDRWPKSWMGVAEDLDYGKKLLPRFAGFLQALYAEGLSRKTFAQYRDHLWLLGGTIIRKVSLYEEYQADPLEKLRESVADGGILPDHYDQMTQAEFKKLPILTLVTALAAWQIFDGEITRLDAIVLLAVFGGLMAWTIWQGLRKKEDALGSEMEQEMDVRAMPINRAVFWLVVGLVLLIVSSRILVWGAVEIAHGFGVIDLIIGLTIVAVGTSLPELASSIIAARKGEHDIALGNILGSNLFNTLAVVGIAGAIHPLAVGPEVFNRDMLVMVVLTLSLFVIGYGFRGLGRINRIEGAVLLACYVGYTAYLISTVFG